MVFIVLYSRDECINTMWMLNEFYVCNEVIFWRYSIFRGL